MTMKNGMRIVYMVVFTVVCCSLSCEAADAGNMRNVTSKREKTMWNIFKGNNKDWRKYAKSFNPKLQFKKRTDNFWNWFVDNEEQLSDFITRRSEYDPNRILSFITEKGTRKISDEVFFNIGGDHEFTFTVEGRTHLFYLYPYLISRMPGRLKDKWKFYSCQPGDDTPHRLAVYGVDVDMADVRVGVVYREKTNDFALSYYEKSLCSLSEAKSYNAFSLMMDGMIGEDFSYMYVADAECADSLNSGMIPLPELKSCMMKTLEEHGKDRFVSPHKAYEVYSMKKEGDGLRDDVVAGHTCLEELVSQYYDGETKLYDSFEGFGARPVFIYFAFNDSSENAQKEAQEERNKIMSELEDEVLLAQGAGYLLGGATGTGHCYIDLLLYDGRKFLKKVIPLLKKYPQYSFFLSEYKKDGVRIRLTGE